MSNRIALKEIANRSCTRGPYQWRKPSKGKRIALVSPHGGETIVMDFVSRGAQGAQPRFNSHRMGIMLTADEWGDELLNHPDFKLLESSYELLELCKEVVLLEAMETDPLLTANKRALTITRLVRHADSLIKRIENKQISLEEFKEVAVLEIKKRALEMNAIIDEGDILIQRQDGFIYAFLMKCVDLGSIAYEGNPTLDEEGKKIFVWLEWQGEKESLKSIDFEFCFRLTPKGEIEQSPPAGFWELHEHLRLARMALHTMMEEAVFSHMRKWL